jgi:predicted MFS family arabinose efflux permease
VDESRDPTGSRIDLPGTITFSGALFGLVFGLIRGNAEGWSSPLILVCLIGAMVLVLAFVVVERRQPDPMLDLSLFRRPPFVGASVAAFALSAAMFAMFLYLTLYMQNILGYSALESGVRFMPTTLLAFFAAPISGKFAERFGVRWFIAIGLGLVGLGLLLMGGLKAGDDWTALLAGFLVGGAGIGIVNPALASAAIGVVEPRQAGMASGINSTFRQVGIATGIAAWGAIFQHVVSQRFERLAAAAGLKPPAGSGGTSVADVIAFGGARRSGNPQFARLGEQAFVAGLNHLLVIAAIVAFAGAALTALLLGPRERAEAPEAVGAVAASARA